MGARFTSKSGLPEGALESLRNAFKTWYDDSPILVRVEYAKQGFTHKNKLLRIVRASWKDYQRMTHLFALDPETHEILGQRSVERYADCIALEHGISDAEFTIAETSRRKGIGAALTSHAIEDSISVRKRKELMVGSVNSPGWREHFKRIGFRVLGSNAYLDPKDIPSFEARKGRASYKHYLLSAKPRER